MSVIDNSTLRKKVYDNISNRILEAQLLPGERMNLRNLSAELGVSISPIRDALWKLESEGSIVIEANKKIYKRIGFCKNNRRKFIPALCRN